MRGRVPAATRYRVIEKPPPLISQRSEPLTASPAGEANITKTAVQAHARRFIFALVRNNNPLILRIKTAQTGAGHDAHRGTGPLGVNAVV